MRVHTLLLAMLLAPDLLLAQLTTQEKMVDFQQLAALYAKRYAPYEWKRDVVKFDLLDLNSWTTRIAATRTDLEFFDVESEYVSRLNDAHDVFILPSTFVARLNFSVDIYEGRLLVDSINRSRLPAAEFPFLIGYELVSIDGVDASKLLEKFLRYSIAANDRSTRRLAAEVLTTRPQQLLPSAPDVPEIATVVFRRDDGTTQSHRIPWTRSGLPITSVGHFSGLSLTKGTDDASQESDYMQVLNRLWNCRLPDRAVVSFGSRTPSFVNGMGEGFTRRLGADPADFFYSGVFQIGGYKLGFIRIPDFDPASQIAALTQFATEITYFQANTDGLIVDVTRNPGGSVGYTNQLLSWVIPNQWNSVGFEVRATSDWVVSISSSLESAKAQGAPDYIIALLESLKKQVTAANREFRGRTGSIPIDDITIDRAPATSGNGSVLAYRKPVMVLIDEMSASAADMFAATIQDNDRGKLFGWRTMGAGGSVSTWEAGAYSDTFATVTESLMYRSRDVRATDFPTTRYVENVGVRPDIEFDYMTWENLVRGGTPYVEHFLQSMYDTVRGAK